MFLNGDATYIIGEIKAKDNLNIANLMQTFENLLLQSYSSKFGILYPNSPWVCEIKINSSGGGFCIIS